MNYLFLDFSEKKPFINLAFLQNRIQANVDAERRTKKRLAAEEKKN
jgi:hypothetical protein